MILIPSLIYMQIVWRSPWPRSVKLEWRYVFWVQCFQKTCRWDSPGGSVSALWLMPQLRPPPSPRRRLKLEQTIWFVAEKLCSMCLYVPRLYIESGSHVYIRWLIFSSERRCEPRVETAVSQWLELWITRLQLLSLLLKVGECKQGEAESRCCAEASL